MSPLRNTAAAILALGALGSAHADLSGALPFSFSNGLVYTDTLSLSGVLSASLFETTDGDDISSITLTKDGDPGFSAVWTETALDGGIEVWSLGATNVSAGTYTLTIVGSGAAAGLGQYVLKTDAVVSNVPEPGSSALLLAGLASIGLLLRRRGSAR